MHSVTDLIVIIAKQRQKIKNENESTQFDVNIIVRVPPRSSGLSKLYLNRFMHQLITPACVAEFFFFFSNLKSIGILLCWNPVFAVGARE